MATSDPGAPPAMPAVYLCQVSAQVSCGACCGLYNVPDLTRPVLEAMLARRTAAFDRTPRTEDGLEAFRRRMEGWTPPKRPFPGFYHCPFLGLIGRPPGRVGCLLHPDAAGNGGVDYRAFSYYGARACQSYLCPSYRRLTPVQLRILQLCLNHWHPYGLVITEHRLLAALFAELSRRIHRTPTPDDLRARPQAAAIFRAVATLKLDWPFRRTGAPGPCHQVLADAEPPRPSAKPEHLRRPPSRYARIFHELDTAFPSLAAQKRAELRLDRLFNRLAAVLS